MKHMGKFVMLFSLLVVIIFTCTKVESSQSTPPPFAIEVYTTSGNYNGWCTATRASDGAIFYLTTVAGHYATTAPGLYYGTYNVYVCNGNEQGWGTVNITKTDPWGWLAVIMHEGSCEGGD